MRLHVLIIAAAIVPLVQPAVAAIPDSLDITCDVDRSAFRAAASGQTSVRFRLWDAVSGSNQCGGDHLVPMEKLIVYKSKTDQFDAQRPRKFAQVRAVLGTDGDSGSPVTLCPGGESWL